MKEKGLLQKGDLIVSVSVKNPKNAKQPKRAKLEIPSSVPPDSFQPKCTCRIGLVPIWNFQIDFRINKIVTPFGIQIKIIPAHSKGQQFAWQQSLFKEKLFIVEHQQVV